MTRKFRIVSGTSAGLVAQLVLGVTQLVSIPIFFTMWGSEKYGIWLLLSTVPAYLSLADLGIFSTVTTQIGVLFGSGKFKLASQLFSDLQKLFRLIALVLILASGALLVSGILYPQYFEPLTTVAILVMSVAISQLQGITFGALRANNRFTFAILTGIGIQVTEWVGLVVMLSNHGSFSQVAFGAIVGKAAAVVLSALVARKFIGTLRYEFRGGSLRNLRQYLGNSLSALGLTLSNAVWIQGSTLIAGAAIGPVGAAVLATYRTITRLPLQFTSAFSQTLWPEFSALFGSGEKDRLIVVYRKFRNLNLAIGFITVSAWFGMCLLIFPQLTSKNLSFDFYLGALFSVAAFIGILSQAPRTLLLGTNRHLDMGYYYLLSSLVFLPVMVLFANVGGLQALAGALVLGEMANLVISNFSLRKQKEHLEGKG